MVTCEICGRALKNKSGLSGHLRLAHAGTLSGRRPDHVLDNVDMESLGHRAARGPDVGHPVASVAPTLSAAWDEFAGEAPVGSSLLIDGVPLNYLNQEALALVMKGLIFTLHGRGVTDFPEMEPFWGEVLEKRR